MSLLFSEYVRVMKSFSFRSVSSSLIIISLSALDVHLLLFLFMRPSLNQLLIIIFPCCTFFASTDISAKVSQLMSLMFVVIMRLLTS